MNAVSVITEPYFLGGEHRHIGVGGLTFSVIPQPKGMGIHEGLFEVALITGGDPEGTVEVLGSYLPESEVMVTVLETVMDRARVPA